MRHETFPVEDVESPMIRSVTRRPETDASSRRDLREGVLVLCDLDGTVYERDELVAGALSAVERMQEVSTVRWLTNTDSLSTQQIHSRLLSLGLTGIRAEHVVTPVTAAKALLSAMPGAVFLTSASVREELGRSVPDAGAHPRRASAVVVGDTREILDYETLDQAFAALIAGARLIALQRGRYFRGRDRDHLDTGAIVAALEYAAEVDAEVLGKPSPAFAKSAIDLAGGASRFRRIVAVGDDRDSDILMAKQAGLESIHVLTGKGENQRARDDLPVADETADSILEAVELIAARS